MIKGRVVTTDFKVVEVQPVCLEADDPVFICAGVDSEGNLYVWGILQHFLPYANHIITQCWDEEVSNEDLLEIANKLLKMIE